MFFAWYFLKMTDSSDHGQEWTARQRIPERIFKHIFKIAKSSFLIEILQSSKQQQLSEIKYSAYVVLLHLLTYFWCKQSLYQKKYIFWLWNCNTTFLWRVEKIRRRNLRSMQLQLNFHSQNSLEICQNYNIKTHI